MQIQISKCLYLLIALTILVSGNSFAQDISITSGEEWFVENKEALLALNQLLLDRPEIKRVDAIIPREDTPQYREFSPEVEVAYENIKHTMLDMGLESIVVARFRHNSTEKLTEIRYQIESRGIFISGGSALRISYVPDSHFVQYLDGPGTIVKPLELKDWYVVVFRDAPEIDA